MSQTARLILLPGLGADQRLFDRQRGAFPDLAVPRWIPPFEDESLREYAARMAETIEHAGAFFLGGSSFGGAVALEMARLIHPVATFLIGSCRTPHSIALLWRIGGLLAGPMPSSLLSPPRAAIAWAMGPCERDEADLVVDMYEKADRKFVGWGLQALLDWEGVEDPALRVMQIHGEKDRLIPARRCRPDHVVAGAGHLLALTHSRSVNAYLGDRMRSPL